MANTSSAQSPVIIGWGHKTKHGKDTAAAHCAATFGDKYDIRQYSFATALKCEFYDALLDPIHGYWATTRDYFLLPHPQHSFLEVPAEDKVAWVEQNKSILGNHLQLYGTEYRRAQDTFYWVKRLAEQIKADNPKFALVRDVRFPNEFLFVKANRGFTVRCNRLGYINPERDPNHISETALDKYTFDFDIEHEDGKIEQLLEGAEEVFLHIVNFLTPKVDEEGFSV